MDVLVTCKYEEDPIKNEGARVDTTLYGNFSDAQGQITLVLVSVSGRNLNSSKLSCMSSLPARMRMIDSKMKELECSQDFSHYKSMGIFQDAQGQLTPQSLVRSGRISNSSEMLWMFVLPASMKKIFFWLKRPTWQLRFFTCEKNKLRKFMKLCVCEYYNGHVKSFINFLILKMTTKTLILMLLFLSYFSFLLLVLNVPDSVSAAAVRNQFACRISTDSKFQPSRPTLYQNG